MQNRIKRVIVILLIFFSLIAFLTKETKENNVKKSNVELEINCENHSELNWGDVTQEDIYFIATFEGLKKLSITFWNEETIDLSPLTNLEDLEELTMYIIDCGHLNTTPLADLKQLKVIHIEGTTSDLDLSFLGELNQLEEVYIQIEVDSLMFFKNMTELREIYIECVDDVDFNYFQKLNKLEKIHIVGSGMKNFEGLEGLINVKELYLFDNSLGEKTQALDMNVFAKMKELDEILLSHLNIADITPLSKNKHLEVITLVHTNITDIRPLAKLECLKVLSVFENESIEVEEQAEKYFTGVETYIYEQIPYPY